MGKLTFEFFIVIINGFIVLYRIIKIIKYGLWKPVGYAVTDLPNQLEPSVLIIIPLLREQNNIPMLFDFLLKLNLLHNDQVIFVTTQKEEREKIDNHWMLSKLAADISKQSPLNKLIANYSILFSGTKLEQLHKIHPGKDHTAVFDTLVVEYEQYPSTNDLVHQEIENLPVPIRYKFSIINYPGNVGMMSDQINYAYGQTTNSNTQPDYLCLLTGDSYVSPGFLNSFRAECKKINDATGEWPEVIQAISLFGRNNEKIKGSFIQKLILQGSGIFQSGFSIFNELIPLLTTENKILKTGVLKADPFSVTTLIGHGCFIKTTTFESHQGFPTNGWCEDIILTGLYASKKVAIVPVPNEFELNEVPFTLKSLLEQMSTWAHTSIQVAINPSIISQNVNSISKKGPGVSLWRGVLKRWCLNFAWMLNPVLMVVFFIKGAYLPALAIFAVFSFTFTIGYLHNKKYDMLKSKPLPLFIGCLIYYAFFYPLAFYYGLTKYPISFFRPIRKPKTER
jgi:cellulose synthase/poly-beta-1,6-N-acetylglucosamine synthase-like glycosyltransferase